MLGTICAIALWFVYDKRMQIPGLTAEQISDDTWFITRDDNHRLAIVIALKLTNRSGGPIRIRNCRLSGYSPKFFESKLILEGYDKSIELELPKSPQFSPGAIINPYTEQEIWFFYESGLVTMTSMLNTQLIIRDENQKRKAVRVRIPRNLQQIAIYRADAFRG